MNMRKLLPFALLLSSLVSCGGQGGGKPLIAASFYPIYFAAKEIAGDAFEVINMTPPGAEPHDLELTPSAVTKLTEAKAIFVNGLDMEPWYPSLNPSLKSKAFEVSKNIEVERVDERIDPHVWLSTENYRKMGENIRDSLLSLMPEYRETFNANFTAFSEKIDVLQQKCAEIRVSFSLNKTIATAHAAYGYMAKEQGFSMLYISSLSPDEEPTQKGIESILDAIDRLGIDTVFFEELTSDAVARKIAQATGAKCESLNPLEGLTQEEIDRGEDYFSVYLENMRKIKEAKP